MAYSKKVVEKFENTLNEPKKFNVGRFNPSDLDVGTGIVGAPACGDVMKLQIKCEPKGNYHVIKDVKFKTYGCGSAIASSSELFEMFIGKTLEEAKEIKNTKILESICTQTGLEVDFGGGIKTKESARIAFECGASKISCGSISINQRSLFLDILNDFGADRIILGADFKDGFMRSNGWLEKSTLNLEAFISDYLKEGVKTVIATDISKDGMLSGSSLEQYKILLQNDDFELIASGGIHSIEEIKALDELGCHGAIIGKAFYEGKISLSEIRELC